MAQKKRKINAKRVQNIGMVMTVSLFLILLTFFILLNSIAVLDENRTRMALGSLIGAFGGLPGGLSPLATGDSILPPSAPMVNEELTMEQLLAYMNRDPKIVTDLKIQSVKDGKAITISESSLFTKDRSRLNPLMAPFMDKLAGIIRRGDFPVDIVGHTDTLSPETKGYKSNWELTIHMALRVIDYFMTEHQIAPKRLAVYGSGSYRPIASNETVSSRAENRRVEIILRYKAPDYIKRVFNKKSSGYFTYKKFDFRIF
jgi:chemotaxis protein MotB